MQRETDKVNISGGELLLPFQMPSSRTLSRDSQIVQCKCDLYESFTLSFYPSVFSPAVGKFFLWRTSALSTILRRLTLIYNSHESEIDSA